ncbi:MAG: sucrase ferredoxin [Mastigocladus sp. ERB_26_2]
MTIDQTRSNCRFCSVISQTNGEDPIGSAGTFEHYLILETAQPWPVKMWLEPEPISQEVLDALHIVWERGRPLTIAPDREYSHPDYTRVLYYRRPAKLFAEFEKHEFIVPHSLVSSLILALLKQPDRLPAFEEYRQHTNHIRELLICTHANIDVACARFGYPIYKKLRSEYANASGGKLRVWRCSHFGGHQFAPTLIDMPQGTYWGHLQPEILDTIVQRSGSLTKLYPFYRGWGGLSQFEQIAEREIWMQEGWDWINYHKMGQVLAIDEVNQDWAKVRIDFTTNDRTTSSAYEAMIELSGHVMTAFDSGENEPLEKVKQYRVSRLAKVAAIKDSPAETPRKQGFN